MCPWARASNSAVLLPQLDLSKGALGEEVSALREKQIAEMVVKIENQKQKISVHTGQESPLWGWNLNPEKTQK